jgi:hypothetical protein
LVHREIARHKKFLRKIYEKHYRSIQQEALRVRDLPGKYLELGSGGGFLKEVIPDVITSDVVAFPHTDCVAEAEHLPFGDQELKGIYLLNVLHHLSSPSVFFKEVERSLVKGGSVVMIDPYVSWLGSLSNRLFHYEPINPHVKTWDTEAGGRLSVANMALPWVIFSRDRRIFEEKFPRLRIRSIQPHTVTCYVLSGGLSWRPLVPAFTFPFFNGLDNLLSKFPKIFPTHQTVILEKSG